MCSLVTTAAHVYRSQTPWIDSANPTRTVVVEYQPDSSGFPVITSILLSLLPVLLLGGFFVYVRSRSRSR